MGNEACPATRQSKINALQIDNAAVVPGEGRMREAGGEAAHRADSFSALKMSLIVDLSY